MFCPYTEQPSLHFRPSTGHTLLRLFRHTSSLFHRAYTSSPFNRAYTSSSTHRTYLPDARPAQLRGGVFYTSPIIIHHSEPLLVIWGPRLTLFKVACQRQRLAFVVGLPYEAVPEAGIRCRPPYGGITLNPTYYLKLEDTYSIRPYFPAIQAQLQTTIKRVGGLDPACAGKLPTRTNASFIFKNRLSSRRDQK